MPATPASFFQRLSAWVFDTSLASVPAAMLAHVMTTGRRHALAAMQPAALADMARGLEYMQSLLALWIHQGLWMVLGVVAFYGIGSVVAESGVWQATWGKRLAGITVEALPGRDEGWRACAVRFAAGALSWLSMNAGHAMIRWRRDGRALHDLVAGMRVVREDMPATRRAWGLATCWGAWLATGLLLALARPDDPVLSQVLSQALAGLARPAF